MKALRPYARIVADKVWRLLPVALAVALSSPLAGCGDRVQQPSAASLAEFENTGLIGPSVDLNGLAQARLDSTPYRVVPGDVLQVQMGRTLAHEFSESATALEAKETYACRIGEDGTIMLPVVRNLAVVGKSLTEIESAIVAAYYPKYTRMPPPVYASVLEYKTHRVSIVGAVSRPGVYALRRDQMSLVALLMEAGGIVERGAAAIRITRTDGRSAQPPVMRSPAVQATVRLHGSPERIQEVASGRPAAAPALTRPADDVVVRAVFEREGPMSTTGWLTFEDHDGILARTWLDVGNKPLRHAFLSATCARSDRIAINEAEAKLCRLADVLESCHQDDNMPLAAREAGWQAKDSVHFLASLGYMYQVDSSALIERAGATLNEAARNGREITLALPVRGLNIPFADVVLKEGDAVVVEGPQEQSVSVIGLVTRPGNFPYPPTAHYTLIQAIALAGGLDLVADPRYVSVYRLKPDGEVASVTLQLVNPRDQESLTKALSLSLRAGDVVSVEQTLRTRTNIFFDRIFRINLGLYLTPDAVWRK